MNGSFRRNGTGYAVNGHRRGNAWFDILKLATPGIGLKRWMLLGALGMLMCLLGLVYVFIEFITLHPPDMLPLFLEGVLLLGGGGLVIYLAMFGLYRSVGPLIPRLGDNRWHRKYYLHPTITLKRTANRGDWRWHRTFRLTPWTKVIHR